MHGSYQQWLVEIERERERERERRKESLTYKSILSYLCSFLLVSCLFYAAGAGELEVWNNIGMISPIKHRMDSSCCSNVSSGPLLRLVLSWLSWSCKWWLLVGWVGYWVWWLAMCTITTESMWSWYCFATSTLPISLWTDATFVMIMTM